MAPKVLRIWQPFATWTLFGGLLAGALGIALWTPEPLALSMMLFGLGFTALGLARMREGGVTPMTFYAAVGALTGFANFVGLLSANGPRRSLYFIYTAEAFLQPAMLLGLLGLVLPILAFMWVERSRLWRAVASLLPVVMGRVSARRLLILGTALAIVAIATRAGVSLARVGALASIVYLTPHFVSFALARMATERGDRLAAWVALGVALVETARAVLFDYLRADMVAPIAAFVFGALVGARSLRVLRSGLFVPAYVGLAAFVMYFGALAAARQSVAGGAARLETVIAERELEGPGIRTASQQTLLSRATSFNQLSQVVRLVHEDGYLGGETLEYLAYAFVPRVFWPEKPIIAKGAWFAVRIGQAYVRPDGTANNAVNMTIAGELFLNFGWPGVVLGLPMFGAMIAVLWSRTRFWKESSNVLGSAFGFYLLWSGLNAADLQIVVTLIAIYLLFAGASFAYRLLPTRRPARRAGRVPNLEGARP